MAIPVYVPASVLAATAALLVSGPGIAQTASPFENSTEAKCPTIRNASPISLDSATRQFVSAAIPQGANSVKYTVQLAPDSYIQVDMVSTELDPFLVACRLLPNGQTEFIGESDDTEASLNARLTIGGQTGANYLIIATADSAEEGQTFDLLLRPAPPEPSQPQVPLSLIEIGQTKDGTFDRGSTSKSIQQYRFTVSQPGLYLIEMKSDDFDSVLELRQDSKPVSSGPIYENDDGGELFNARIMANIADTGTYTISARNLDREPGTYTLSLIQLGSKNSSLEPLKPGPAIETKLLFNNGTVTPSTTGSSNPQLFKRFTVEGRSGQSFYIRASSADFLPTIAIEAETLIGPQVIAIGQRRSDQSSSNSRSLNRAPAPSEGRRQRSVEARVTFVKQGNLVFQAGNRSIEEGDFSIQLVEVANNGIN